MAPMSTVPAVPTIRNGRAPARAVGGDRRAQRGEVDAVAGVDRRSSRSASEPRPAMSMARATQPWAALEA